jgi:hypothetical protein
MPLAREQRKLAAILAAVVVDYSYSRLMGRNESGALATRWSEPFDSTADRRRAWKTYKMACGLDAMVIQPDPPVEIWTDLRDRYCGQSAPAMNC